jgi:enoyl-CoA hydratase/carnithine racemase
VHIDNSGRITTVTIDDESTRNAVSHDTVNALLEAVTQANENPDTRVIVIKGAGDRAFASGADLSEIAGATVNFDGIVSYDQTLEDLYDTFAQIRVPIVAAVQAAAIGGGGLLALACDVRIAAEGAVFALPAAGIGLTISRREYRLVHERLGSSIARYLLLTGHRLDAFELQRCGVFHQVVPAVEFADQVDRLARRIADLAPLALAATKSTLHLLDLGVEIDRDRFEATYRDIYRSDDLKEGISAMKEKRTPAFRGG